ncbi:MAG: YceI family protein [Aggregatilineales bacterium]
MNRTLVLIAAALVIFGVGTGFGFILNNALLAGDGEASEPISAPTLDPNVVPTMSVAQLSTQNAVLQAQLETLSTQIAEPVEEMPAMEMTEDMAEMAGATEEVTEEAAMETDSSAQTADDDSAAERSLFRIDTTQSEARFNIQETLRGERITVVGTTEQVAGDVVVDFGNPGASQVGTIRINVRTIATDSSFRNDAIRGRILQSSQDQFEFSEFVPTDLIGLPESVAVGDTITFQIVGDLTIRDITNNVIFDATVTVDSETLISGLASTTVFYPDYNLVIPSVPQVSDVADDVVLEIEFVATLVEE